ncbi:MAG TPA: FAD-dependent monooxygenase, partial [Candidatus Baltobacteraceae bacterium]|nr:FAD-dependent monooxygenase [Candidatus Baltobacteraceae bacterium]
MNIVCIGGGPAGLYFGLLMKKARPQDRIRVVERNRPYDTFGWGVVFSDATLENLRAADAQTHAEIERSFAHWDDIEIHFKGTVTRSGGHGFSGIARKRLLNILQHRAEELGVELEFERDVPNLDAYAGADLIVAADGINSRVRSLQASEFQPGLDKRKCRFVWLGTTLPLDAFTFIFERTAHGWFTVHAYRFDDKTSTFIVECREETWLAHGLDNAGTEETIAFCEELFAPYLHGHRLMANSAHLRGRDWLNFVRVTNEHWTHGNVVLLGDAAHTAHFSVGSGTKLAMEDAIALQTALCEEPNMQQALARYEGERRIEVLRLQNAARNSTEWFENVERYAQLPPEQFAYSLLTRSQRISHENLRLRDREWLESVETWYARRAGVNVAKPRPPMFTPLHLRGLTLQNRIVVSPMSMYSARDGTPDDFHLVHYGARAQGGAALLVTEMTDVSADARITPGCACLYNEEHERAWARIVDFVHGHTDTKISLQLGHAGPKGSTKVPWEGEDEPLDSGNWPLIAPSPVPWSPKNQVPRAMDEADMERVVADFVAATRRADSIGFDMIELHAAHGYLLSAFLTPAMNRRTDAYGGGIENRLRFPLVVFAAMRRAWPQDKPMSVR